MKIDPLLIPDVNLIINIPAVIIEAITAKDIIQKV